MKILALLLVCTSPVWAKPGIGGRLVGGQTARNGQFPSLAAIYVTRGGGTYFCSGNLISNQWIISGAHSVENATNLRIQLGSNTLSGNDPNRLTLATATYVIHPSYDEETLDNDIALIKLRLAIEFNQYIGAISLPSSFTPDYSSVTAAGWGQLGDFSTGLSNELVFVPLTTISNDECQLTYGAQITYNKLCVAGNLNEGLCNGDMGGALVQNVGGTTVHVGVASFTSSNGCETPEPSGYTRTIPFVPWIREITQI